MCGPGLISEEDKARIAANNAHFREVSKSPFGPDDDIGMLNLMTSESMRQVVLEADGAKVFDLAVDYFLNMPSWTAFGDPPYQISMTHTPVGTIRDNPMDFGKDHHELVAYSGDAISMYTHCGTHLDTLNHFGYHGKIWNHFSADEHLGSRHWHVAGSDKHPPVIARGVVIDVAGLLGVDVLPDSYGVGEADLINALQRQQTDLRVGDVVLLRTGRMRMWDDASAFIANEPGLNREGAEYLARAGAMMIGADNVALEQLPTADPENWQVVHTYLLAEAGIPIMEMVNTDELAAEKCYEFAFIGACLKLRGSTGSPIRPMALPLRNR